jgi:hypothetical protein
MIQRLIFQVLQTGVNAINQDSKILDDIFAKQWGLSEAELASIKTFWTAKPPTVIQGYARQDSPFPLFAISLLGERESDKVIGDEAFDVMDPDDPEFQDDQKTAFWHHDFAIWVYSEHPDVTLYYYEIVKHIILVSSDLKKANAPSIWVENGVMDIDLQGQDLVPDARYVPSNLFVRQLRFSCKREFKQAVRGSRLAKAFKVSGIYLDSSGGSNDAVGVQANVTTFEPGGSDG